MGCVRVGGMIFGQLEREMRNVGLGLIGDCEKEVGRFN